MALVNVTNVIVLDNPTVFTNPFQFEVCAAVLHQCALCGRVTTLASHTTGLPTGAASCSIESMGWLPFYSS